MKKKTPIVRHTLMIEDESEMESQIKVDERAGMDLIPTTDLLKSMNVVYDEVLDTKSETEIEPEEFVITQIENKAKSIDVIEQEEEQITLTFDLPLSSNKPEQIEEPELGEEKMFFSLDDEVKDINVNEPVEIISVTEVNEEGETRYALEDDFETYESSINTNTQEVEVKEEVVFEKKVLPVEEKEEVIQEEIDPMNSPISELLIARADERRKKMKDFNYKFNNAKIDEIEKEPAYKRQGVNLEDAQHSSETNASRMSVGTDDNDDIQLRSNNSFLHDNVD